MKFFTLLTVLMVSLSLLISGCATHKSPQRANEKFIFLTSDEEAIFEAAYEAMFEGHNSSQIIRVEEPVRGYTLTRRWALDYWTSVIEIFPAEGVTEKGEVVRGYYPEVSGKGTLVIRGPSMDGRIYEAALKRFSEVGQKTNVKTIKRVEYRLEKFK